MVVLLTDGRANVSLAKSNDDPDAIGPDAVKPSTVRLCVGLYSHKGPALYDLEGVMPMLAETPQQQQL